MAKNRSRRRDSLDGLRRSYSAIRDAWWMKRDYLLGHSWRDVSYIAKALAALPREDMANIQHDRRRYHPSPEDRPLHVATRPHVVDVPSFGPDRVGFINPSAVTVCQRREQRRQVLNALGIAGRRGLGRGRKRHMSQFSQVSCKRRK